MPTPILLGIGGAVLGTVSNIAANNTQKGAAEGAAGNIEQGTALSNDVTRQMFDANQQAAKPYVSLASPSAALTSSMLTQGQTQNEQAMASDPVMQAIKANVESTSPNPTIANAVFGRISPALVNQLVQDRIGKLTGLAGLGVSSAAGQAGDALQNQQQIVGGQSNVANTQQALDSLNQRYTTSNLMQIPSALGTAKSLWSQFGVGNTAGASGALNNSMNQNPQIY
jgi:hypothetical protein